MNEQAQEASGLIWQAHGIIERANLQSREAKGMEGWEEQRRLLLADLACHLAQDVLTAGPIDQASLQNHLYAILTVCDGFLPERDLKQKAAGILL